VRAEFVPSARGYVLFDNTVLDKRHSQRIELVRRQYSGNAHGITKGIGLVNCGDVNPETQQFWLLYYRLFALEADSKSKPDHVAEMLQQLAVRRVPCRTVLLDSWYATTALFKQVMQAGKFFYCLLKNNRLVDDSGGQQPYQPVALLTGSANDVAQSKLLKVKNMPKDYMRRELAQPTPRFA